MKTTKEGIVEHYSTAKSYGFILATNSDGTQTKFFLHWTQLMNGIPMRNSRVRFTVGPIPPGKTLALAERVFLLNLPNPDAEAAATKTAATPETAESSTTEAA